jgi:hypothetical protein
MALSNSPLPISTCIATQIEVDDDDDDDNICRQQV